VVIRAAKPQKKHTRLAWVKPRPGAQALEELKEMKSMGFNLLRLHAAVG
jgi:hypothetical protein